MSHESISRHALALGQLCAEAIRTSQPDLYSSIVEVHMPEFLDALAAQALDVSACPTPNQLLAAMRRKGIEEITIRASDILTYHLFRPGESLAYFNTEFWLVVLEELGLAKDSANPS